MSAPPPSDVRFDVDHVMDRALAANEADLAEHGRIMPTLADVAEIAYEAFGIGLEKMTNERYAEAIPWLASAVDSGVEAARPMLAICLEAAEPSPSRRAALGDEREDAVANQLADAPRQAGTGETPIFHEVVAAQHDAEETSSFPVVRWVPPKFPTPPSTSTSASHWAVSWAGLIPPPTRMALPHTTRFALPLPPAGWESRGRTADERCREFASQDASWFPTNLIAMCSDGGCDAADITESGVFILQAKWRRLSADGGPRSTADVLGPAQSARVSPPARRLSVTDLDPLIEEARHGTPAAVRAILQIVEPLVVRYCRARLGRQGTAYAGADDVAQEACLSILKALPDFEPEHDSFLYFVRSVAAEQVDRARRFVGWSRADRLPLLPQLRAEPMPSVPARRVAEPIPSTPVRRVDLGDRLQRMVGLLPRLQQEVVVLRVVVGLSATETAEAVGVSPGAVRLTQHRALVRLRAMIQAGELPRVINDQEQRTTPLLLPEAEKPEAVRDLRCRG